MHARFRAELRRTMLDTPLGRWMQAHRGELAQLLHGREVDWAAIAQLMAAHGLQDASGTPLRAAVVQNTWAEIDREASATGRAEAPGPASRAQPPRPRA